MPVCESERIDESLAPAPDAWDVGMDTPPEGGDPQRRRPRHFWWFAVLAVLVCLAAGFINRGVAARPIRIEPLPFGFRVQQRSDYLLLTWNPAAGAVRNASRATLSIQDGPQSEDAELTLDTLHRGGVRYYPVFEDVSFRLTLANPPRQTVSEGARPGLQP